MPAIDSCEPQVVRALEKEGWTVIKHHVLLRLGDTDDFVLADLRLQKDAVHIVVVEVKCFAKRPFEFAEFYQAVGLYLFYRNAMRLNELMEPLYLAIPVAAYQWFSELDAIQATLQDAKINLIVVDLELEEVLRWIH